jgi:predicted AAA+ superfamily ATPase
MDGPPLAFVGLAGWWSMIRGGRSGRVAWQFVTDLAGRLGKTL